MALFDLAAGRMTHDIDPGLEVGCWLAFSPDGQWLAAGGHEKTFVLWGVESGEMVRTITTSGDGWVNCLEFSPDGRLLASSSGDGIIDIWDVAGLVSES